MSNFTPKKLDENLINGGQQYKSGDVVQPIAINAPIEAILLLQEKTVTIDGDNTFTGDNVFERITAPNGLYLGGTYIAEMPNTGKIYLGASNGGFIVTEPILQSATNELYQRVQTDIDSVKKQIKEQSNDIQNLYAISLSNNLYGILQTTQAYETRKTAEGANIIDKQYAPVTRIDGATVFSANEFKNAAFTGIKSVSKNLLDTEGQRDVTQGSLVFSKGKISSENTSGSGTFFTVFSKIFPAGTYTFSAQNLSYSAYTFIIATDDTQISGMELNPHYTTIVGQNCWKKNVANATKYFTFTVDNKFRVGVAQNLPNTVVDRTCVTDQIQLVEGSAQSEYTDFVEDTEFYYEYPLELGKWDYALPQEGKVRKSTVIYEFTGDENISDKTSTTSSGKEVEFYFYAVTLNNSIPKIGARTEFLISNMSVAYPDDSNSPTIGVYWLGSPSIVAFWCTKELNFWDTKADFWSWLSSSGVWVSYKTDETETDIAPKRNTTIAYKNGKETVVGNYNSEHGAIPTITQEYFELVGGEE